MSVISDGSPIKVGLKDGIKKTEVGAGRGTATAPIGSAAQQQAVAQQAAAAQHKSDEPTDCYLKELYAQITSVVASKPDEKDNINEGKLGSLALDGDAIRNEAINMRYPVLIKGWNY